MKLSELIINYRKTHDLSQRQFATMCGVSNGYISMIEAEQNNHTGRKMNVSLGKLHKIASGMNMSLHELLKSIDDMDVSLEYDDDFAPSPAEKINEGERVLLDLFRSLSDEKKEMVIAMLRAALQPKG